MFTGIVEELGSLLSRIDDRYVFAAVGVLEDVHLGDSIAVNGCCLTVVSFNETSWQADVTDETRRRTTLDGLSVGDPVNLERPVRLADRMGGHLVQGHVDAVGTVVRPAPDMRISFPSRLLPYVVEKGSVTVDGVSLTVVDIHGDDAGEASFGVALIPHTCEVTTLGGRHPGDGVNIEVDVMAKYAERLLAFAIRK